MKTIALFFLLYLCTLDAAAQSMGIQYVWAGSGLNLRKTPQFNGTKIKTLPYGTAVEVLEYAETVKRWNEMAGDYDVPLEHHIKAFTPNKGDTAAFYLSGFWVKVKLVEGGQTGFLFDAYLSALPIIPLCKQVPSEPQTVEANLKRLREYLKTTRGVAFEQEENLMLKDGTYLLGEQKWLFPEMARKDGILLVNHFLQLEKKASNPETEIIYHGSGGRDGLDLIFFNESDEIDEFEVRIEFFMQDEIMILLLSNNTGGC